ncbi:MAG: RelA/SpoT family protein [Bacteroidia bacterium]|nr:RelA/SpoT family protein [Bacteroidia bacterium]
MSLSEFNEQDYELIEQEYQKLLAIARKRCPNEHEFETVKKAFDFANEAHKNVRRRSGEPYILHPLAVARIVVENIGLGYKSIAAALLHDVVEDTDYTVEDIRTLFGDKIASLVDGLTKIKNVLDNEGRRPAASSVSIQAENFKRILLTLNDDVRVVLIKLADRLHNCRTIEYMPEAKRDKILSETMYIFIPLAHRLGLYEVKSEMENIWLRYKEPEAYSDILAEIDRTVSDKDAKIDEFIAPISAALQKAGFDFRILKRVKTPYSIWYKMRTKNIGFEQIYDLYAVRIIFNPPAGSKETERDQCYHIFSIITSLYKYKASRMRDWVKHPKSNGYEALHCTVMSQIGIWIEIQIRSKRMDDIAEKGIAAHWAYKREGFISENDSEMDKWLSEVKEIIMSDDVSALELLDIIHNDLTGHEIVVYTPKGDQRTLQKGATVLDFAYNIHTKVGNHAIAAKVNMKLAPLSQPLKSGDQVEILTAMNATPKAEWLRFLQSHHARTKVVEYFKTHAREETESKGALLFRQEMKALGRKKTNSVVQHILDYTGLRDFEEFCFRLGLGMLPTDIVSRSLSSSSRSGAKPEERYIINPDDPEKRKYYIAPCCNPIPGDAVIGVKTLDGRITVHKKSCEVADNIASKHGDWVVVPMWESGGAAQSFPVRLSITGIDRVGLLNDISYAVSNLMGFNMRKVHLGSEGELFSGYIELLVKDKKVLDELISKLSAIDGLKSILRTDI